uniref:Ubiquitin carboxyl-terminal hydrolase 7 n=1 Tax=Phallusia mammillata TaxID=59560 RepID=A0A6F9DX35_9ASCI|nr:ubiquitin carboxyl-terminal hydrolase 7-like [Phallusia mammillata]
MEEDSKSPDAIAPPHTPEAPDITNENEAAEKMETEEGSVVTDASMVNGEMSENDDSKSEDITEEDDEYGFYRSEATFSYTVENIHKLTESVTSPPTYVRGLPWRILVMPRMGHDRANAIRSLGYFLQCNAENDSTSWSCHGSAELRILPAKEGVEMIEKKIDHVFYCKENDWGFSTFLSWADVVSSEKGFMTPDKKMTFQVHVFADAPHGLAWDSRKLTGYIGLKNQGATCYMNSLLQTLYFTNKLRKAVYMMPTDSDDALKSVPLALQRVFYELQSSDKPVGTKKLTKSFGWETLDSFMQHDVQELSRVLLDNVELKMKGTCVEGTIPGLLEGKFKSYVKCKNVDYVSSREESFFDVQLIVKGNKNIQESFKNYVKPDTLDGDNKFDAGDFGMQEAEKGIIFKYFPSVLHLQLLRFQYDPVSDMYVKTNDRYEFPEVLNLDEFMEGPDENDPAVYILHAILVHSGDNHGGHYVAYLNPKGDGKWCKFDDDVVSRCTKKEAFLGSFGGVGDDSFIGRNSTNAYMLVYIRKNKLKDVLCSVNDEDIPEQLMQRLSDERALENYRRKERQEAHLFMAVNLITEDMFCGHQGEDLFDFDRSYMTRHVKIQRQSSYEDLMQNISKMIGFPTNQFRLWLFSQRPNTTWRPALLDVTDTVGKTLQEIAENENPWHLWLETLPPDSEKPALPVFDKQGDILLFLKMYNPHTQSLSYCGHVAVPIEGTKVVDIEPELRRRGGLDANVHLQLFEEISASELRPLNDRMRQLGEVMDKLMDGNIIVFQPEAQGLPDAMRFFLDIFYRVDVLLCDKNDPLDPGFVVSLNRNWTYGQFAKRVAERLDTDPMMLQFFRVQTARDMAGSVIRSSFDGQLKDLLQIYGSRKQAKRLYYQQLTMKVDEFETKRQFKCLFVTPNLKEEEIVLYPNRTSCVASVLEECRKKLNIDDSHELRLLEVVGNKICEILRREKPLEELTSYGQAARLYRIEIVPDDQKEIGDDEVLICTVHFHKEIYNTFGTPILIKIRTGERFHDIKERIQKAMEIADNIFEKYKIAVVVNGQVKYMSEDMDITINLKEVMPPPAPLSSPSSKLCNKAWIGLDHLNKNSKRHQSRFGYTEKAIKIHN